MKKTTILICLSIVLISTVACTKEEKSPVPGASLQQAGQQNSTQISTGNLMVKILPESPTSMTDLQAAHSGTGKVAYHWKRNGTELPGENTARLAKNLFAKGDTISATVVAEGSEGSVSVVIGNSSPVVSSVNFSPDDVYAGTDIIAKASGYDPDGDEVMFHYKWTVNGKEVFEDTSMLAKGTFKRGDVVSLRIIPYDKEGEGTPFVFRDTVIPNAPPRITSAPPQNFEYFNGSIFTYQARAEDPDGDPVTFTLSSAPPGMTIDSKSGLITWLINEKSSGAHTIEVGAQDSQGLKEVQTFSFTIKLPEGRTQ
jgi:hypothetical protein